MRWFKYEDGLKDKQIVVSIDVYAKQKKWTFCTLQIKVLKAKAVPKYVVDIGLNVLPPI